VVQNRAAAARGSAGDSANLFNLPARHLDTLAFRSFINYRGGGSCSTTSSIPAAAAAANLYHIKRGARLLF